MIAKNIYGNSKQRAVRRVINDPAFFSCYYVLIEDHFIQDSVRLEFPPCEDDASEPEKYYEWLCDADQSEVMDCAANMTRVLRNNLRKRIEKYQVLIQRILHFESMVHYPPCSEVDESLDGMKDALDKTKKALDDEDLEHAALGISLTEKAILRYHKQERERHLQHEIMPLAARGEKTLFASQKGYIKAHKTFQERAGCKTEWQNYINEIHGIAPLLTLNVLRNMVHKHFNVSMRTLERYRIKPT